MNYRASILKIYHYFSSAYGARLLILANDVSLVLVAFFMAILLRHNFDFPQLNTFQLIGSFALIAIVKLSFFIFFKTYVGIIRFTGQKDILQIVASLSSSMMLLLSTSIINQTYQLFYIPISIVLIDWLLLMILMIGSRVVMRLVYTHISQIQHQTVPIAIFGAGACGRITLQAISSDKSNPMKARAFFDDELSLQGKLLTGINIYDFDTQIDYAVKKYGIQKMIIAVQKLSFQRKTQIINKCLSLGVKAMIVPPLSKWLNSDLQALQIRQINIEDLLNRECIELHKEHIEQALAGEVILVTGAAGSIGSEIAEQIASYKPIKLILLDQAESPLWERFLSIKEQYENCFVEASLTDVRDYQALLEVFEQHRPTMVFHAAAYKHVPILESFPHEAIKVNVLGVKNIADLSVAFHVKKFVFVSTDKAVNPTNVMGASKRISEMYVQALNNHTKSNNTSFITTRFGNVLGSNGSVVPRFKKQIEEGGPITVTHKDITRYFMTIPEACQLVLEAGVMGKGGEIFVFDMGKPIKIADLARKMIQLAGFQEGKEVKIVYTGLREGEKLYEELLNTEENTLPTHHEKIMIGRAREKPYAEIAEGIMLLQALLKTKKPHQIVAQMKSIVPEFVSNASRYEILDNSNNKTAMSS